jgi:phenylacetate-CoA ligase
VGRLDVAFKGLNNMRYAQIIQEKTSALIVNIVVTPAFGLQDQELLLGNLRKRVGDSLSVTFNKVEEKDIIKTKAGKFKLVVSRLRHNYD